MENPYKLLGVEKDARAKAIKTSYRTLAKKYHPDINPGDKAKEERFKQISAAYELLSDTQKRTDYDNGKIDEKGNPIKQQYTNYNDTAGGQKYHQSSNFSQADMDEILKNMFRNSTPNDTYRGSHQENTDEHYTIEVDFMEAAHGAKKTIQIPNNKKLDLAIPKGIKEGQKLRLKGQGKAHPSMPDAGDIYITVTIRPHTFFERKDNNDIYVELPISIDESILGKKVTVPTVHGPVEMQLPTGVNTGTIMKLKGKGILTGDQYVKLKIVMPKQIDTELETFIQTWATTHAYNPRKHLENIT